MRSFRSDNNAGQCPEALAAIQRITDGNHRIGYGDDELTAEAVRAFQAMFGEETAVFFVATGTAANVLSIASLTEVWQQVICHEDSHFNEDESTAPERVTHCRVAPVRNGGTKITPEDIRNIVIPRRGDLHQPQPGVVTITNATEWGTVYTPAEVRAVCECAHELGYRVHMDGARFANAVASLGCDPKAITVEAGVDALSFGGTKNGLAQGEAVLFFKQGDGAAQARAVEAFPFHRKGTGHLLSKHWFVSAPFAATLADNVWLRNARHANAMARRMERGLREAGCGIAHPVEANVVFARMPEHVVAALEESGQAFYALGDPADPVRRIMCSFDTTEADVDAFIGTAAGAMTR
jgi:threonine aldolase